MQHALATKLLHSDGENLGSTVPIRLTSCRTGVYGFMLTFLLIYTVLGTPRLWCYFQKDKAKTTKYRITDRKGTEVLNFGQHRSQRHDKDLCDVSCIHGGRSCAYVGTEHHVHSEPRETLFGDAKHVSERGSSEQLSMALQPEAANSKDIPHPEAATKDFDRFWEGSWGLSLTTTHTRLQSIRTMLTLF